MGRKWLLGLLWVLALSALGPLGITKMGEARGDVSLTTFSSQQVNPILPEVVLLGDAEGTFARIAKHHYGDGRKFDLDLDRIGKEITIATDPAGANGLAPGDVSRFAAQLSRSNVRGIALPIAAVAGDPHLLDLARRVFDANRFVYFYGADVKSEEINRLLNITLPSTEQAEGKTSRPRFVRDLPAVRGVVGVAKTATGVEERRGGTDGIGNDLKEDILRSISLWELRNPRNDSPVDQGDIHAASPDKIVDSWHNHYQVFRFYEAPCAASGSCDNPYEPQNGSIAGSINIDWYLKKDTEESDRRFDYFALRPRYEVRSGRQLVGNSWDNQMLYSKDSLVWAEDELMDRDPVSQAANAFSVKLGPTGFNWEFDLSQKAACLAKVTYAEDWASWQWNDSWGLKLGSPFGPEPGVSWASTGRTAEIYTEQIMHFKWNHQFSTQQWEIRRKYDDRLVHRY